MRDGHDLVGMLLRRQRETRRGPKRQLDLPSLPCIIVTLVIM